MRNTMKYWKKLLIVLSAIILTIPNYAQDFTKDELDSLRNSNLISQEDYEILLTEIGYGELEDEGLYSLKINEKLASTQYKIRKKGQHEYYPLFDFLEKLNLKNYIKENDKVLLKLGEDLKEVEIDKNKKLIKYVGKNISKNFDEEIIFEDEIYIEKEIFKQLFLINLNENSEEQELKMELSFNPPFIVEILAEKNERELKEKKEKKELVYTNSKKLFELGNMRINTGITYTKDGKTKESDTDWTGLLEYQGAALYGESYISYDMKENNLGDMYLLYNDVFVKGHKLELGSYSTEGKGREWGLSFRKEKYYFEDDKKFIIESEVPIGSRVELLYLGTPIEIKDAENGKVRFENNMIQGDKKYQLKIYTVDGKIELRDIYIKRDYNQQNKGETEYNFEIRENHKADKMRIQGDIYHGLTEKLTVGTLFDRKQEDIDGEIEDVDTGRLELVYSDLFFNKYGYTLEFGSEKVFNSYETALGQDYSKRYANDISFQVDVDKFRFTLDGKKYGKYYDEETEYSFETEYNPSDSLRLTYEYDTIEYRDGRKDDSNNFEVRYDYKWDNLLTSSAVTFSDDEDNRKVDFNLYYTGFWNNTISLNNSWAGKDMDYTMSLNLYNNRIFDILDYEIGISYNESERERVFLEFTLDYENIFEFSSKMGNKGSREYRAGINKTVDLKNIKGSLLNTNNIELSSSRVKVITFVDENNNDIYDNGEKLIDNVEVEFGNQTIVTDKNGVGELYGIPENILVDLEPKIRKPSYTLGNNEIKVLGKGTSTIVAYVPVKPLMTLSGLINIDKNLKLSDEETLQLYNELIIKVTDKNGEVLEITLPDENGVFMVSGLFIEEYKIEIEYIGTKFKIPKFNDKVQIAYNDSDNKVELVFEMNKNKITLNK